MSLLAHCSLGRCPVILQLWAQVQKPGICSFTQLAIISLFLHYFNRNLSVCNVPGVRD